MVVLAGVAHLGVMEECHDALAEAYVCSDVGTGHNLALYAVSHLVSLLDGVPWVAEEALDAESHTLIRTV